MTESDRPSALVAGATGLVGRHLVEELRTRRGQDGSPAYREVILLVRRPSGMADGEEGAPPPDPGRAPVREIVQRFSRMHWVREQLVADHVFCAIGTTIRKAGSQTRFAEVDHDYPVTLARITRENGARHFSIVSSMGASLGARNFYLRTKGQMEADLEDVGFPSLAVFRPSVIGGKRGELRLGEALGKALLSLVPGRLRTVRARDIAAAMVTRALQEQAGLRILESEEIRKLARTRR